MSLFNWFKPKQMPTQIPIRQENVNSNALKKEQELKHALKEINKIFIHHHNDLISYANTLGQNSNMEKEVGDISINIANIANKLKTDLESAYDICHNTTQKIAEIKAKNSDMNMSVVGLNNQVAKIDEFLSSIDNIIDQTKVIAFNASLEAASAGENGKRFAVVAGEINRLADDIAKLTKQIKNHANQIKESSGTLIITGEDSTDKIMHSGELLKEIIMVLDGFRTSVEIISSQGKAAGAIAAQTSRTCKSIAERIEGTATSLSEDAKKLDNIDIKNEMSG
jgi:methyl-accepting chemotaxis protein